MALAYVPPGVSVQELVSPNVAPLLASPANVCVVGKSRGYRIRTDQVTLTDVGGSPAPISLPGIPSDATLSTVISVKDALDPTKGAVDGSGYVVTTNYTVNTTNKTITRVESGSSSDDLQAGAVVNVTYTYLPADYFVATRLDSFAAVEERYGPAWATSGNAIETPVTYAAQQAFENGAAEVVVQPLFARSTPGDPTTDRVQPPSDASFASVTTWQDTLYALRDIEDINVLVPAVGQSQTSVTDSAQLAIFKAFKDHIYFMRAEDQYIVGVFGEDSSASNSVATQSTLRAHATELKARYGGAVAQHTVFVEPSRFARQSPITGVRVTVGGQYVAAELAGALASQPVSQTLTRASLSGVEEVLVPRLKSDKNANAQAGLTVIEQRGRSVQVRHAITLDDTNTSTRELSVVRAKHRMIESVRDTIDTQIIGKVIADDQAPLVVRGAVIGVLEALRGDGDLAGYRNVDARTVSFDPTTIEVRFSYRPAFPVNYVDIVFSLDLTNGGVVTGT